VIKYATTLLTAVLLSAPIFNTTVQAQLDAPGWANGQAERVDPGQLLPDAGGGDVSPLSGGTSEPADVAELARGLQYDPLRIFNYVHNHIEYTPYFGLLKGASQTLLERSGKGLHQELGVLLVGFCGSWLGGALFWGWLRLHPVWHLPVEAFALPLAVAGLGGRWRVAGAFYLASLLGTAATDAVMAATGVMELWPEVLRAPLAEAPLLLQEAGRRVLAPLPLTGVLLGATLLLLLSRGLWSTGTIGRVAAACLVTTLVVDGLFLAAALLAPQLSGVI